MIENNKKAFLYPPGGILIWIIILVELITFAAGLTIFSIQRNANPELFYESGQLLLQNVALINTIILITGGYFMAMAVSVLKKGDYKKSSSWTLAAIVTGLAFLLLKSYEYYQKLEHGISLDYNSFFTFYWLLTGFHYLHVLIATLILVGVYFNTKAGKYSQDNFLDVESSAAFWHMCDLIWLLLFAIIYLLN
ncbi:MAG TPA: nitric oxide reductase [Trueperaceae bacterium]|nr:nitric oxide reductase [Trueperaceae bacterium]